MIRISEQYVWHVLFALLFLSLVFVATVALDPSHVALTELSPIELLVLSLATLRLTRLFVYDSISAFFREQFYDLVEVRGKQYFEKPKSGPRRVMNELLSCPWCVGLWMGASVVFLYELTPYSWYAILFLAIAGLGSMLQIFANYLGWKAEAAKGEVES